MKRSDVDTVRKIRYIGMAIVEYDVTRKERPELFKTVTDKKKWIIRVACQYSSKPKLKPEDFEGILDQPFINHL